MTPQLGRRGLLAGFAALATAPASAQAAHTAALTEPAAGAKSSEWVRLPVVACGHKQDDIRFVDDETGWYANGAGRLGP